MRLQRSARVCCSRMVVAALAAAVVFATSVVTPLPRATAAQPIWDKQSSLSGMKDILFTDALNGHAVGKGSPAIYTTADGGASWTPQFICASSSPCTATSPDKSGEASLNDVAFPDAQHGFAVGVGTEAIVATVDGGASWKRQYACYASDPCLASSTDRITGFSSVSFTDPQHGHAATGNVIVNTADGGARWTVQPQEGGALSFRDGPGCPAEYPAGCHGWAFAGDDTGRIFVTHDGGTTWTEQYVCATSSPCTAISPDREFYGAPFTASSFTDHLTGHAVGRQGTLIATTDGGDTWRRQVTDAGLINWNSVSFTDSRHGRVVSDISFWATSDGGATWTQDTTSELGSVGLSRSISCTDITHCHVAKDGAILVLRRPADVPPVAPTLAPPEQWGRQATGIIGTDETLRAVTFVDGPGCPIQYPKDCYGYAVGDGGVIFATTDGGATWTRQVSGTTSELVTVSFTDHLHGHVGGANGTLLATTDGGRIWTAQNPSELCGNFGCNGVRGISFSDGPSCPPEYPRGCYGFAVARGGTLDPGNTQGPAKIIATVDGGKTWTRQVSSTGTILHGLSCADHLHCWAVGQADGFFDGSSAIIVATSDGGVNWRPQSTGQGDTVLRGVSFTDSQHGHAVGGSAAKRGILATTTGGAAWISQTDPSADPPLGHLYGVSFTNEKNGHAVGTGGSIHLTADGGTTWRQQFACEQAGACATASSGRIRSTLFGVSFTDELRGHAVGAGGTILGTIDGGETWRVELRGTLDLFGVAFPDNAHGYVVGEAGTILFSSDLGKTWAAQTSGSTANLRAVSFPTPMHGYAVGDGGEILATTNGGNTWAPQASGVAHTLRAVSFTDAEHGHAVGDNGTILVTANGGRSWSSQQLPSGISGDLLGISLVAGPTSGATSGHAVGTAGLIIATTNGGTTWQKQTSGVTDDLVGVSFGAPGKGHVVIRHPASSGAHLLATDDNGLTWRTQYVCKDLTPESNPCTADSPHLRRLTGVQLRAVWFRDATHGHAVGTEQSEGIARSGVILATVDGGRSWVPQSLAGSAADSLNAVAAPRAASSFTWAAGAGGTIVSTFSFPGRITDLSASVHQPSTVRLAWGAVGQNGDGQGAPALRYQIRQAASALDDASFDGAGVEALCDGACFAGTLSKRGDIATFDVSGLARGVTYHWGVRAVDKEGLLGPVSTVSAQIPDLLPGMVTDLVAQALSNTAVELSFSAPGSDEASPPPASAYVIKQSNVPMASLEDFEQARTLCGGVDCTGFSPIAVGDRLSLKITGLRPETTYFYALRARDGAGQLGPMSNVAQVNTDPVCVALKAPSATQVTYPGGYSLVGLPGGTVVGAESPLYGWFDQRQGDYLVAGSNDPVAAGRGYWAWFGCPTLVELAVPGANDASFPLGAYRASMVGNPSVSGPTTVTGHDFTARWDPALSSGVGGYHISSYREPSVLAVGEGIWAFSYVDTTVKIVQR